MFGLANDHRRKGDLVSVGMAPHRNIGSSSSSSSSSINSRKEAESNMLSVATEVRTAPALLNSFEQSLRHIREDNTRSLDFSCTKGDYVAILAEPEQSEQFNFWIAEAAEDIIRPKSDEEAVRKLCAVFYFTASPSCTDYTDFVLEPRKRSMSTVSSTLYDTILSRVMNVEKQRGMTNRMSISSEERDRLCKIAKQQLNIHLNEVQKSSKKKA